MGCLCPTEYCTASQILESDWKTFTSSHSKFYTIFASISAIIMIKKIGCQ